jgi:hypothetical protein
VSVLHLPSAPAGRPGLCRCNRCIQKKSPDF